jgi:uncharacterized cofD-like protein
MLDLNLPKSFASQATGEVGRAFRNEVVPKAGLDRPTRIVCIGGGTGLPVVLKGLLPRIDPRVGDPGLEVTAVVAMSDDGGSSGKLRRSRGLLPPGDIRNCLVALSPEESELSQIFQYRFDGSKGLGGHSVGNLLIAALAEKKGNFLDAVRLSGQLLNAKGTVLPSTLSPVQLVAELDDKTLVIGERNIVRAHHPVSRVTLSPRLPPPTAGLLEAIRSADIIALGPGSLYSSILPNLLVDGVAESLATTRALKVLVANLMTQPGETDEMDCVDHLKALFHHAGRIIDVVLVNGTPPSAEGLARYAKGKAHPVRVDTQKLLECGVIPVKADLLRRGAKIRHDGRKVARCLLTLARNGIW